ncbi:hypothetical protein DMUE_3927 [Dictyocoela muelleri]|nr:hypothetical protein DMUE_3927 [Dictyocoela muelleri]
MIVDRTRTKEIYKDIVPDEDIPKILRFNLRNDNFLIFDSGIFDLDRIIIFQSPIMNEIMKKVSIFTIDGTFRSVLSQFIQLITVNGFMYARSFPVAFILSSSKKETSYKTIFKT